MSITSLFSSLFLNSISPFFHFSFFTIICPYVSFYIFLRALCETVYGVLSTAVNGTPFEGLSHSKCEYVLNYTTFSPYLKANRPFLYHKNQIVNSVEEKASVLLHYSYRTHNYYVWAKVEFHSCAYDSGIYKCTGLLEHDVSEKLAATVFSLAQEGLTMEIYSTA